MILLTGLSSTILFPGTTFHLPSLLSHAPFLFSRASSDTSGYIGKHTWRFGARIYKWDTAADLCLSGSGLCKSIFSNCTHLPENSITLFFTDEYSSSMHMYHIFIIHLWVEWHWAFSISLLLWIKQQWAWLYKYLWSRVCSPSWSFCF